MLSRKHLLLAMCVFMSLAWERANAQSPSETSASLPRAHAHNDYLHERPLLDALENGFCSVEADIFWVDGQLLVAHTRWELSKERTLQRLYLDPLRDRLREHGGSIHGDGQPLTLLIDIKSEAEKTYRALHQALLPYVDILSYTERGRVHQGPVSVVVSGNRAVDVIASDGSENSSHPRRLVGIDGRLSDLASDQPPHLLPLISDNWNKHFRWRGVGELPPGDKEKLSEIVSQVHRQQRRLRFWAIPDTPAAWAIMQDAGVDLINTDDLAGLRKFLESSSKELKK